MWSPILPPLSKWCKRWGYIGGFSEKFRICTAKSEKFKKKIRQNLKNFRKFWKNRFLKTPFWRSEFFKSHFSKTHQRVPPLVCFSEIFRKFPKGGGVYPPLPPPPPMPRLCNKGNIMEGNYGGAAKNNNNYGGAENNNVFNNGDLVFELICYQKTQFCSNFSADWCPICLKTFSLVFFRFSTLF